MPDFPEPDIVRVPLTPAQAREILWRNNSPHMLVMCSGYGEDDDDMFTELVWPDDQHLDFEDANAHPQFQLWLRFWPDTERHHAG